MKQWTWIDWGRWLHGHMTLRGLNIWGAGVRVGFGVGEYRFFIEITLGPVEVDLGALLYYRKSPRQWTE